MKVSASLVGVLKTKMCDYNSWHHPLNGTLNKIKEVEKDVKNVNNLFDAPEREELLLRIIRLRKEIEFAYEAKQARSKTT